MADDEQGRTSRLREHRLRMALTQQDVATRLEQLAWVEEQRHVGVNADMISKWERGLKRPSPFYSRLLCTLFSTTAADLGIGTEERRAHSDGDARPGFDDAAELLGALELLEHSATKVEALMPRLIDLWRTDVLGRRQLLKAFGIAPVVAGLEDTRPRIQPGFDVPQRVDQDTVDALLRVTRHLETSYHVREARDLLLPVRALIETLQDFLPATSSSSRPELLGMLARANLLAGRLFFFDLQRPFEARSHLDLAREAAEEANNWVLDAVVLGHVAFVPAAKQNFTAAESYLGSAHALLDGSPLQAIRSWLHAVASEIHARAGDTSAALRSSDSAAQELVSAPAQPPAWFDFYDTTRLAGFQGFALRQAGRFGEAQACLERMLADRASMGAKQTAVTLIDLAAVHVGAGEFEEGCHLASAAVDELGRANYATGFDRLVEFSRGLPDPRHPAARLLRERISELS